MRLIFWPRRQYSLREQIRQPPPPPKKKQKTHIYRKKQKQSKNTKTNGQSTTKSEFVDVDCFADNMRSRLNSHRSLAMITTLYDWACKNFVEKKKQQQKQEEQTIISVN